MTGSVTEPPPPSASSVPTAVLFRSHRAPQASVAVTLSGAGRAAGRWSGDAQPAAQPGTCGSYGVITDASAAACNPKSASKIRRQPSHGEPGGGWS